MRKIPCTLAIAWLLVVLATANTPSPLTVLHEGNFPSDNWPPLEEKEIKCRFQSMRSPIMPVFDSEVEAYLRQYLTYGTKETRELLGRAQTLFPIIEHYLAEHDLPEQLKFIPMIESSYVAYAVSTRGAAGLWQITPSTATHFGLTVNEYIDERKDPYKSTEAAVKYLKGLYKRFGTWELALVAYNYGPSRLSQTIKTLGSSDFGKIKAGLPKETQRYLARYLAACYTGTFYQLHGLSPDFPNMQTIDVMAARIYRPVSLFQVAEVTGLELSNIRQLNPAFKGNYLPANVKGTFLVLPRKSWNEFLQSQNKNQGRNRPLVVP